MSDKYNSYSILCRDCLAAGYFAGQHRPVHCTKCQSPRLLQHDELFTLSIAHVDCDAFYCSVEKRDNPELKDKPVIVGGGTRGVVAAACYVARQYGIRSAMPSWQALKACPDLIVLKPRMAHYQKVSRRIKEMMNALTPLVQPLSIDEAFIDLSGTHKLHGRSPAEVLVQFQKDIKQELGLTISVGLAPNKSLAKIASDQDKPDGFFIVGQNEASQWLADKPVSILFGLGKAACARLEAQNIRICADIVSASEHMLKSALGSDAPRIAELARGIDRRAVIPYSEAKSISTETTFSEDLNSLDALLAVVEQQCQQVSRNLKAKEVYGKKVTLKLKQSNHKIITRSSTLAYPTQMAHELFTVTTGLLTKELATSQRRYRLIGVGVELIPNQAQSEQAPSGQSAARKLCDGQLFYGLDEHQTKKNNLEQALDEIHKKLGENVLKTGRQFNSTQKDKNR